MKIHQLLTKVLMEIGEPGPYRFEVRRGGDTAISVKIAASCRYLFGKVHENAKLIDCEAAALETLARFVRVPEVQFSGEIDGLGVLVMECLDLHRPQHDADWQRMGQTLARLHELSATQPRFGFPSDNYIGGSPQHNGYLSSWQDFFVERRLEPQLAMADMLPATVVAQVKAVIAKIDRWIPAKPQASLLHGDLWHGNLGLQDGEPVFYDPACYYGDRQVDLAMMALFGSVPDSFYLSYQGRLPNADEQNAWRVYDLYHLLNHVNLFGSGYAPSVERVAGQLLQQ